MNAASVKRQLAAITHAGRALRERPQDEIVESLATVLESWRNPASPWRRDLERRLPELGGFTPETLRQGLDLGLEHWSGDALRELVDRELGGAKRSHEPRIPGFQNTAVVLAGSIPMPSLLALIAPLLLRSPVLAKPAARDPLTPSLVERSVRAVDAPLASCLAVADFRGADSACTRALLRAECVVAMGSDQSLARIEAVLPPGRRLVAHGHRLSIAVVGEHATRAPEVEDVANALALDTALWDQSGCLSPVAVYVVSDEPGAAERTASALAAALESTEAQWPAGRIEASAAASRAHEIELARMRVAAGSARSLHEHSSSRWVVVCEGDAQLRPAPLHRFLRVHPVQDLPTLKSVLQPIAPHLAGVALAGFRAEDAAARALLSQLGASRICAPGRLQAPPLGWRRDRQPVLLPMSRAAEGAPLETHNATEQESAR